MMDKLIVILFFVILCSCSKSERPVVRNVEEYRQYYKEESKNLTQDQIIDELKYSCKFIPRELLILKRQKNISSEELQNELKKYSPLDWILGYEIELNSKEPIDILKYRSNDIDQYRYRIQQLTASGEKYFHLEIEGESEHIQCKQVVFDRSYGLSNKLSLRLFFRVRESMIDKKIKCVFNDEIFGGGIIKNDITEQILKSPILKLSRDVSKN